MKNWIYVLFALIFCTIFCLMMVPIMAHAAPKADCRAEPEIRHDISTVFPNTVFADLDGKDLKIFLDGFNALPPKSNTVAEHALIIKAPQTPFVNIVFFNGGCMFEHDRMTPEQFQSIFESF